MYRLYLAFSILFFLAAMGCRAESAGGGASAAAGVTDSSVSAPATEPTHTPTPKPGGDPPPENAENPESTATPEPSGSPASDPTDSPSPTITPTQKPTETPKPAFTVTTAPTDTPMPTDTPTPTFTQAAEPTDTPEIAASPEPTETPADTPTPEPTQAPAPTFTPTPEPTEAPAPPPEETKSAAKLSNSDFSVTIGGISVKPGDNVESVINALGSNYEYSEIISCDHEGMDKTFTYSNVEFYTYPDGSTDRIDEIVLASSAYQTSRGVAVSDGVDKVINAYGEDYADASQYYVTYRGPGGVLYFYKSGDTVTSISIARK